MTPQERQDYEPDTPRCLTCVYFKREPLDTTKLPVEKRRDATGKVFRTKAMPSKNRRVNPIVEKCTFGNFVAKPGGVCREWHGRDGSRLAEAIPMRLVDRL